MLRGVWPHSFRAAAALVYATALIAGFSSCAQSGGVPLAPGSNVSGGPGFAVIHRHDRRRVKNHGKGKVTLVVRVPQVPHRKHPRFVDPYTASVEFDVWDQTHTQELITQYVNIVPTDPSSGCTLSQNTTQCGVTVYAPLGPVTVDVIAYDRTNARGHVLSSNYGVPYDVGSGAVLGVTLNGIPRVVLVSDFGTTFENLSGSTLDIAGLNPATVSVQTQDANGWPIAGPGSPTISITYDTSALSIAPVQGKDGQYTITPLKFSTQPTTVTWKATPPSGASASFAMTVQTVPIAAAADYTTGELGVIVPWNSNPVLTVEPPVPSATVTAITFDDLGDAFVAYSTNRVIELDPAFDSNLKNSITSGINTPYSMTVDSSGTLYVSNNFSSTGNVTEYAAGAQTPSLTTSGLNAPYGIALDSVGNLYVADSGQSCVVEYPAGAAAPGFSMCNGVDGPVALAFDSSGNLYVANHHGNNVVEFSPPFTANSSPAKTFSNNVSGPYAIALDSSADVYVSNTGQNTVIEFANGGGMKRTLNGPKINFPYDVVTDPFDNAYVASFGAGLVAGFAPSGSSTSATYNIGYPQQLAVFP